ncbi:MAG: hypothetical protein ACFB4I_07720 [Cyanophyceae cyanobacterium]
MKILVEKAIAKLSQGLVKVDDSAKLEITLAATAADPITILATATV